MRLIDAEPIEQKLFRQADKAMAKNPYENARVCAFRRAFELILNAPTIAPLPNDPLTLEELREMVDEIADDFISYVTGGVQNAAPYCANVRPECCERPGWCTGYSKACKGFYPKAYRRKPEEKAT